MTPSGPSDGGRSVRTVYGPVAGCPDCDVIPLHGGPHLCEHGVTTVEPIEVSVTATLTADEYARLREWL